MATGRVDVRAEPGWRRPRLTPSLAEVYRTVPVGQPVWWRKALAFAGPGYLVAVGYMDPGNWATDLAGGSAFGYSLLSVILIATIAGCFIFEILISRPGLVDVAAGFVPGPSILQDPGKLYIAIGILGATVMPHNLYLHSSIVQTRRYDETPEGKREAVKYAFLDSTIALTFALFINAAILIVAAATFHRAGHHEVAEIQEAYRLLTPLLGVVGASAVFAFALLASGQNSTLTGTLAGQIVMEGFLNIRLRPWLRRLITRGIAIVPAAFTAIFFGEGGTARLLILSQVILSLQLSFAVFPLVRFTSERMREDRAYLEQVGATLRAEGFDTDAVLAAGDPPKEIAEAAERERCDLIAMATHGHRLLGDVVHGSTATALRHMTKVPILMVRADGPK